MMTRISSFLPGVPEELLRAALNTAPGNELASGKLDSPRSSAALAVNAFGWFVERPERLPSFPTLAVADWPPLRIDIERTMRYPWPGGRHPWLDAGIETHTQLIGVEAKRFEPFLDATKVNFSDAYDRDVWGDRMGPFTAVRDALRTGTIRFFHLHATQLVKHAFGLVTEGRRLGKTPALFYLYGEPAVYERRQIAPEARARHRDEIAAFAAAVAGAEVRFAACSYREWLAGWIGDARIHADALIERFQP